MIILYEIAYGVYDAMRIVMTRQAQTHTHTHVYAAGFQRN